MELFLVFVISSSFQVINCWPEEVLAAYNEWRDELNITRTYACVADENLAIANFMKNKARIDEFNKKYKEDCNISYALGLWDNSHLSEFQADAMLNGLSPDPLPRAIYIGGFKIITPQETFFDWTDEGAVSGIRNQGDCACCYSFAATGSLESQIYKKYNYMLKLSDQQVIDCSGDYNNRGCDRGNTENVFKYIRDNGIAPGYQYPFKGMELDVCNYNPSMMNATCVDYRRIPIFSNAFLRDLLYSVGPLAVGVDASLFSFLNYKSGIYNDPECSDVINHAMLLVGFGTDDRYGDYWILKNSYGKTFGEKGFMRMSRTIPNFCGLWTYVTFPIIN